MARRAGAAATAAVFAALGDETRLAVVSSLKPGEPQSITHLTGETKLTRQAMTKHLRVLEGAGLVTSRRVGRESLFELRPRAVNDAADYLARVSRRWDDALERLRAFVEDPDRP